MDRLYCSQESTIVWNKNELAWLSLVRPVQIFAPLVTFVLLPLMLIFQAVSPTLGKVLNTRMLFMNDLPIKLAFRIQLLIASMIMTPSAYLHCIATLVKNGKFSIGFLLIAPLLIPFTAVFNGYTTRDDSPSAHFDMEWPLLVRVYEGASLSNGTLRDVITKIRDSL